MTTRKRARDHSDNSSSTHLLDKITNLVRQAIHSEPFTDDILAITLPRGFKPPRVDKYDGTKDPLDHITTYRDLMRICGYNDAQHCRAFSATLVGPARRWFQNLGQGTISSFEQLAIQFVDQFYDNHASLKTTFPEHHLLTLKQGERESLRSYLVRFKNEYLQARCSDEIACAAMMMGLRHKDLLSSLHMKPPTSFADLVARARRRISAEDFVAATRACEEEDSDEYNC